MNNSKVGIWDRLKEGNIIRHESLKEAIYIDSRIMMQIESGVFNWTHFPLFEAINFGKSDFKFICNTQKGTAKYALYDKESDDSDNMPILVLHGKYKAYIFYKYFDNRMWILINRRRMYFNSVHKMQNFVMDIFGFKIEWGLKES